MMNENSFVLDQVALDAIRELSPPGGEDLLGKIIGIYIKESTRLACCLAVAVEEGDYEEIRKCSHSLKSSSANVGATTVSTLSRDLEIAGSEENLQSAGDLFSRLQEELKKALAALSQITGQS
jgi:HPt (histidine-containing phosphotransfer) domain-containing protein